MISTDVAVFNGVNGVESCIDGNSKYFKCIVRYLELSRITVNTSSFY